MTAPDINSPEAEDKPYVWIAEAREKYREGDYTAAGTAVAIANAMMMGRGRA